MIPNLITINDAYWAILPPGVHVADMKSRSTLPTTNGVVSFMAVC